MLDLALDFIWKTMHCASIKIFLHHYKQQDHKLKVNEELKALLKQRRFKWKTLKNEVSTGMRIEVMEGLNLEYKEQLSVDTAFMFRRGLSKADFMRDTLTYQLSTKECSQSEGSQLCFSLPALMAFYNFRDSHIRDNLKDAEDNITYIRELLENNCLPLFKSIITEVSLTALLINFD